MRISSGFSCEIAHQQTILQFDIFRHGNPYGMPITRCDRFRDAFGIFHLLEAEVDVALRGHQFQIIAKGKFVFHRHFGHHAFALAGKFTDELLALGDRETVFVVLIIVMRVATQETFGVATMGEVFQRFQ